MLFFGTLWGHNALAQHVWLGITEDWGTASNWSPATLPTTGDAVTIGVTSHDPVISLVLPRGAEAASVTIESGVQLTITSIGNLRVGNTLTNNGIIVMGSDATYNSSLICRTYTGAGEFTYERYLEINDALPESEKGWHLISSPVAGFSSHNLLDYYLNTWDEPSGMWVQHTGYSICHPAPEFFNNGTDGWSVKWAEMYSTSGCPNPGTGQTVEFEGIPNSGNITHAITADGSGAYHFNLVGNPYPSYWDYDAFYYGAYFGDANVNDAIYYWDENTHRYASYVNGISVNGGVSVVAPGQAFWLEANGPGTLKFTNAERTNSGSTFFKDAPSELVKLTCSANGFTDETVVYFGENSTINKDRNDALKMKSDGSINPNLYTKAGDADLSINGMPSTEVVPVYFECSTSGTYIIEATETSNFNNLVLEDMATGQMTDLLESSYTFSYASEDGVQNFNLHFAPVGVEDIELSNINIWSNTQHIYVTVPEKFDGHIQVYNLLGQEIEDSEIKAGVTNAISINDPNGAYYIVRVVSNNNVVTRKVYVK